MDKNNKAIFVTSSLDESVTGHVIWGNEKSNHEMIFEGYSGMDSRFDGNGSATIGINNFPVPLLAELDVVNGDFVQRDALPRFGYTTVQVGGDPEYGHSFSLTAPSTQGQTVTFAPNELLWVVAYQGHYVALMNDKGQIGFIYIGNSESDVRKDDANPSGRNNFNELIDNEGNHYFIGDYFRGFSWMS
jgi:hypothetical protein